MPELHAKLIIRLASVSAEIEIGADRCRAVRVHEKASYAHCEGVNLITTCVAEIQLTLCPDASLPRTQPESPLSLDRLS